LEIENLVLNYPIEASTLGCTRIISEAIWLSTLEHLLHSSEVWRSIHIPALVVG